MSKLTQDIPCSVDCVITNNARHHLDAPNVVLSCFMLTELAFLWKQLLKVALLRWFRCDLAFLIININSIIVSI